VEHTTEALDATLATLAAACSLETGGVVRLDALEEGAW
jgi:hypothetical protein